MSHAQTAIEPSVFSPSVSPTGRAKPDESRARAWFASGKAIPMKRHGTSITRKASRKVVSGRIRERSSKSARFVSIASWGSRGIQLEASRLKSPAIAITSPKCSPIETRRSGSSACSQLPSAMPIRNAASMTEKL